LAAGLSACCALFASGAFAGSGCGLASWYGLGGQTASGEYIDPVALTAAHRTLPFGTRVKVENLDNGRTVVVRINDRGPFIAGRDIDLTRAAAEKLDFIGEGVAKVRMTVLGGGSAVAASDPCGRGVRHLAPVITASVVPMPHERPVRSFATRFAVAFAAPDQTNGVRAAARALAMLSGGADDATVVAAAAPVAPRRYPENFFATRFDFTSLSAGDEPQENVARELPVQATAYANAFASAQ
jgi:rare lipoprotein A